MRLRTPFEKDEVFVVVGVMGVVILVGVSVSFSGDFVVNNVFPYGTVDIKSESTDKSFKINGHRLKPFLPNPSLVDVVVEETSLLHPISISP